MTLVDCISEEFSGVSLGDERLDRRLRQLASAAATAPAASFPVMAQGDAALEATYRFFGNERVEAEEILRPHIRQTSKRAAMVSQIVVAHDTTEFNFGKSSRKDLGRVGQGKSFGFYAHVALVVSATEQREPLGVIGQSVHQRTGGKGKRGHKALQSSGDNESRRWHVLVNDVEDRIGELRPIHVMDREADSYALMANLVAEKRRFVIRMASDKRRLDTGERVCDQLLSAALRAKREVPISSRRSSSMPSYRKHFPPRIARPAQLEIRAERVTIKRPASANKSRAKTISLNVVHVIEPQPPEGEPAVEWRLWTSESVELEEDVLAIVDAYRSRWRIEEYFKALKSGCAMEKRQLETHEGLVRTLALFTPIAWRLLLLRTIAHRDDNSPGSSVLTKQLLVCLRFALEKSGNKPLPESPTACETMWALARLGGHLKRNGPPGWITLGRGLDKLLNVELGYLLAVESGHFEEK